MVDLTRMGEEHLAATLRWLAEQPQLRDQIDSFDVPTEAGNRAYWRKNWQDAGREDYAIVVDGRHVGNCGLTGIDKRRGKAEIWIYLGEGRGGGVGGAALQALMTRGFDDLGLRRLFLRVVEINPRARAFYLRHGFTVEGTLRADSVHNGRPINSTVMAMLSEEWRGRTGALE